MGLNERKIVAFRTVCIVFTSVIKNRFVDVVFKILLLKIQHIFCFCHYVLIIIRGTVGQNVNRTLQLNLSKKWAIKAGPGKYQPFFKPFNNA